TAGPLLSRGSTIPLRRCGARCPDPRPRCRPARARFGARVLERASTLGSGGISLREVLRAAAQARGGGLILVDAASDLFSQPPRFHVLHEQRTGTKFLAEALVQELEDAQPRIEADEIGQLERS